MTAADESVTVGRRQFPVRLDAIVFDFDGVFTDDCVWVSADGMETVKCSREDGQGITRSKCWGLPMLILSTETNPVVSVRANKLGMEVIQNAGLRTKADSLRAWLSQRGFSAANVIFMGNDLNDVECMKTVGFAVAPASARECAKEVADLVLSRNGGSGAVRELIEFVAEKIGKTL